MEDNAIRNRMGPDEAARQALRVALAEVLVVAELEFHRSINDDAQRDAAVGNYIDREEAGLTAADVRRFEKTLKDLGDKRDRLERKRDLLMSRALD